MTIDIKTHEHYQTVNAKYPRIASQIELFWGYDGFDQVIGKLLNDTRDGVRQGFPIEIADALMKLMTLHRITYPHLSKDDLVPASPWFDVK